MSKISIGIDFGISNTDLVIAHHDQISYSTFPSEKVSVSYLKKILSQANLNISDIETIGVTGGRHADLPNEIDNVLVAHFNEVDAIGRGAKALKKDSINNFLVVSCGSGTACVLGTKESFIHVGGTGLGGGTIRGLCKLLFNEDDPERINTLSLDGDVTKVDQILSDVVSGPIGNLPENTSAVNFGKGSSFAPNNADLAAGVINMVAQTILRTAVMSAISCEVSEIIVIGRTPSYSLLSNILKEGFHLYNLNCEFVENGEYAICLGTI